MPNATRDKFTNEGGFELLEVCGRVHGGTTGAYDYLSTLDQARDIHLLEHALANWEDSSPDKSLPYDNAVKLLIEATLQEIS